MELFDLYTVDRERTGRSMPRGERVPEGFYRLVVHVCIFNGRDEMLIQRRQPFKQGWSGMWDITVGGSAVAGDTSRTAVARELSEELGLELSFENERPALTVNFPGGFNDIYLIEREVDLSELKLQYEEVCEVKWSGMEEILRMIDAGEFIPYKKSLIELIFAMRDGIGGHTREDAK
ncbi:MAG: NUDIX domain-containing protein [Butyrivibrio sp.]|nr:NUDIX domain-containing protein [Butyrivibrio sp.]